MPVNHAKEFLKSVHNEALFSHLFSRTLIEVRSVNFKAKFLKMAKINSEFLNVSMVEPAPESATTLVSLVGIYVALGNKGRQNVLECSLKDLCKFSSHGAMLHGIVGWYAFSLSNIVQKFTMKYSYTVRNPSVKDF